MKHPKLTPEQQAARKKAQAEALKRLQAKGVKVGGSVFDTFPDNTFFMALALLESEKKRRK